MFTYGPNDKGLDEIMRAYEAELSDGTQNLAEATGIAFQYRVARAQVRWAFISALIAGASVVVAIAAVIVAATK